MRNDVSTPTPLCSESHVWCMCGSMQESPNLLILYPADQPRVILRKCFIAQTVLHCRGDVTHRTNPRQVILLDALERKPSMQREHLWRWRFLGSSHAVLTSPLWTRSRVEDESRSQSGLAGKGNRIKRREWLSGYHGCSISTVEGRKRGVDLWGGKCQQDVIGERTVCAAVSAAWDWQWYKRLSELYAPRGDVGALWRFTNRLSKKKKTVDLAQLT